MTPVQQYPGEPRARAEVAIVRSHIAAAFGDDYHSTIAAYLPRADSTSVEFRRLGLPGFTDYPKEVHLEPGRYAIEVYCFKSIAKPSYRPVVEIAVKGGSAYRLRCVVQQGQAVVDVVQEEILPG